MGRGRALDASLLVYFTNRANGVSHPPYSSNNLAFHVGDNPLHVKQNRILTCKNLKIDPSRLVSMDQIHSANIKIVSSSSTSPIPECDGILTNEPNLALLVQTADCTPVLIYSPDKRAIGALHVGRAGAFKKIVPKALEMMQNEFNVLVPSLHVWIGPAIQKCCYEIDKEVLEYAKRNFSSFLEGKRLDIAKIIIHQLTQYGVQNIHYDKTCTSCDKSYFSYRREKTTGRQGGIIMLKEDL
jgi:YfiH family protein